jgi:prevent-host-death family protein
MNIKARAPTIFTSREFNQNTAGAKRAAENGPVFITDRGKPAYVLMSIEEYRKLEEEEPGQQLKKKPVSLAEALADNRPEADFDWEPPRMSGFSLKVPDFE